MVWDDDEEAWLGTINGVTIAVAYSGLPEPDTSLLVYAESLTQEPQWLARHIQQQVEKFSSEHPYYHEELQIFTTISTCRANCGLLSA